MITVMLVSDQPIMCEGLRVRIQQEPDMRVVSEASDVSQVLRYFVAAKPDVALIDLDLPRSAGLAAMNAIRSISPSTPLVVLAEHCKSLDPSSPPAPGHTLVIPKSSTSAAVVLAIRQAIHL